MLQMQDLSVAIGRTQLLMQLSLTLGRGEILGLVGESGSGKSLTALAILGLLPDTALVRGQILFDGTDLLAATEEARCRVRGRRIGMVFQEPMTALNPVRSIGAQIAEGMRLHQRLGRAESDARTRRLLDRVGLPAPRFPPSLYPHQLSGGQRQRVVIAIALACGPDLLIADEPTTALGVTIQAQILDLLGDLVAETNMALLLITHDLGVVADIAGRVAVMYSGRVVETGPTRQVFAAMAHPYTNGLFAAASRVALAGSRLAAIPGVVPEPPHRPPGCAFAPRCPAAAADCLPEPPALRLLAPSHQAACLHPRGAA